MSDEGKSGRDQLILRVSLDAAWWAGRCAFVSCSPARLSYFIHRQLAPLFEDSFIQVYVRWAVLGMEDGAAIAGYRVEYIVERFGYPSGQWESLKLGHTFNELGLINSTKARELMETAIGRLQEIAHGENINSYLCPDDGVVPDVPSRLELELPSSVVDEEDGEAVPSRVGATLLSVDELMVEYGKDKSLGNPFDEFDALGITDYETHGKDGFSITVDGKTFRGKGSLKRVSLERGGVLYEYLRRREIFKRPAWVELRPPRRRKKVLVSGYAGILPERRRRHMRWKIRLTGLPCPVHARSYKSKEYAAAVYNVLMELFEPYWLCNRPCVHDVPPLPEEFRRWLVRDTIDSIPGYLAVWEDRMIEEIRDGVPSIAGRIGRLREMTEKYGEK